MKLFKALFSLIALLAVTSLMAQQARIDNLRPYDQEGVNEFEYLKKDSLDFEGVKVRLGGNFAQQFQALEHSNTLMDVDGDGQFDNELYNLEPGFNLATANLNIDVELAKGVRLNLVTYLSSRHHPEAWVKGGFIQVDDLSFLNSDFADKLMENITIRAGHMEINYGDAHFRRTDNGNAMYNPFVGNYIVDAFNTEIGGEVYYQKEGWIAMLGITGGEINGNITEPNTSEVDENFNRAPSIIGKIGYDSQVAENVRLRITGSAYHTASSAVNHLYSGDRGGSRYYLVMSPPGVGAGDRGIFSSGRYSPGFMDEVTAFMGNAFVKAGGFEFFGTYEMSSGRNWFEPEKRNMTQVAADVLYRFGKNEDFYIGGRYNTVNADVSSDASVTINRYQIGGGWFVIDNILLKAEYVNQEYLDFAPGSLLSDGNFSGLMIEAVVGF
jgi:hypothetical protein